MGFIKSGRLTNVNRPAVLMRHTGPPGACTYTTVRANFEMNDLDFYRSFVMYTTVARTKYVRLGTILTLTKTEHFDSCIVFMYKTRWYSDLTGFIVSAT